MNNYVHSSLDAKHKFSFGDPPFIIDSQIIRCGRDFIFIFGGGSAYHLGAVAVCIYHPSLKDPKYYTSTTSVISIPGHKEDMLARSAAHELSRKLKTNITVCVGLHIDNASQADIKLLEQNFNQLISILKVECSKIYGIK